MAKYRVTERVTLGNTVIAGMASHQDALFLVGTKLGRRLAASVMCLDGTLARQWEAEFEKINCDSEVQGVAVTRNGILVCGCTEGRATEAGGEDWKVFLSKISFAGNVEWQRSYRIGNRACAYSIAVGREIALFGEARRKNGKASFFLIRLDAGGNVIRKRMFGQHSSVLVGGFVPSGRGWLAVGSHKQDKRWVTNIIFLDSRGCTLRRRVRDGYSTFSVAKMSDGLILAGEKMNQTCVQRTDRGGDPLWERCLGNGTGTCVSVAGGYVLVGGDSVIDGAPDPLLFELSKSGHVLSQMPIDGDGWLEAIAPFGKGIAVARHGMRPREHTEIVIMENIGMK